MKGSVQRILLISKENGYAALLEDLLHDQNGNEFEINQVFPLSKALGEINAGDYSLVILDLPADMDCVSAAESVCKASAHLPIVVFSKSKNDYNLYAIQKGVQDVISKENLDTRILSQKILIAILKKKNENEIRMRDEILEAVNEAAEIFLTQSNWEIYLDDILAELGKATRSDRVYILQNFENGGNDIVGHLKSEWVADGIHPQKTATLKNGISYKKEGYQRWLNLMKDGQIIHSDVNSLPDDEKSLLLKLGVKSFVYVPIYINKTLWGFIGFDQCSVKNDWSQVEIDALKTSARIIGAAISRQAAEDKLTYLATHDYLTDLPNRLLFEDRFHQAIARAERSGEKFSIVSIDMDKFKSVNDSFGHPVGDEVLFRVARRLEKAVRASDTCARIGGDEFALLVEGIHTKGDAIRVMQKVLSSLSPEMIIEGNTINVSASMGASLYPLHGSKMEDLLKAADKALYNVKGTGSKFRIYSNDQISWLKD